MFNYSFTNNKRHPVPCDAIRYPLFHRLSLSQSAKRTWCNWAKKKKICTKHQMSLIKTRPAKTNWWKSLAQHKNALQYVSVWIEKREENVAWVYDVAPTLSTMCHCNFIANIYSKIDYITKSKAIPWPHYYSTLHYIHYLYSTRVYCVYMWQCGCTFCPLYLLGILLCSRITKGKPKKKRNEHKKILNSWVHSSQRRRRRRCRSRRRRRMRRTEKIIGQKWGLCSEMVSAVELWLYVVDSCVRSTESVVSAEWVLANNCRFPRINCTPKFILN